MRSKRTTQDARVAQAGIAGVHIVTIPYKILTQMRFHQKTEERIAEFDRAWQEFKQAEKTD